MVIHKKAREKGETKVWCLFRSWANSFLLGDVISHNVMRHINVADHDWPNRANEVSSWDMRFSPFYFVPAQILLRAISPRSHITCSAVWLVSDVITLSVWRNGWPRLFLLDQKCILFSRFSPFRLSCWMFVIVLRIFPHSWIGVEVD